MYSLLQEGNTLSRYNSNYWIVACLIFEGICWRGGGFSLAKQLVLRLPRWPNQIENERTHCVIYILQILLVKCFNRMDFSRDCRWMERRTWTTRRKMGSLHFLCSKKSNLTTFTTTFTITIIIITIAKNKCIKREYEFNWWTFKIQHIWFKCRFFIFVLFCILFWVDQLPAFIVPILWYYLQLCMLVRVVSNEEGHISLRLSFQESLNRFVILFVL